MYRSHFMMIAVIIHMIATGVSAKQLIGQPAPDLGIEEFLQAPEGAKSLSALKGKVVVLEFWATWCAPCIAEIPHLNRLSEEFRDKPVQFISVTDEGRDVITQFLKRKEMKSWIGLDTDRSAFKAYGVNGIPRTFLINREGIVVASRHPAGLSSDMIAKVIEGKKIDGPKLSEHKAIERDSKEPIFNLSITPTEKEKWPSYSTSMSKDFRKLEANCLTLHQALSMAYGFPTTRILGSEELLDSWYRISAKLPLNQFDLLLQQALTTSLQLHISNLNKPVEVLVLTAGDDSKKKLIPSIMGSSGSQTSSGAGKLKAINGEIRNLAGSLENILKRIVVDETGLKGKYDWEISFDKDNPNSVLTAIEEQLGLYARKEQKMIEFLIVDTPKETF